MSLVGGAKNPRVVGLEKLPGRSNYFIGNDRAKWRTAVPSFARVKYESVYRGIDLIYHGNQDQLEYDFVIAPGVSSHRILMRFEGNEKLWIDTDGKLVIQLHGKEIRQSKPVAYQTIDGNRREVEVSYRIKGQAVGFTVGDYDRRHPLVIDPVLLYSSYLGGTAVESGMDIAVDSQGSAEMVKAFISSIEYRGRFAP